MLCRQHLRGVDSARVTGIVCVAGSGFGQREVSVVGWFERSDLVSVVASMKAISTSYVETHTDTDTNSRRHTVHLVRQGTLHLRCTILPPEDDMDNVSGCT